MAPKKVEEPERKPLIGRVGTNLKVGIVGIPNVGKSTFFNVLTKSQAAAENFPFCTIDPNENKMCNSEKRIERKSSQTSREYCAENGVSRSDKKKLDYDKLVNEWPPSLSVKCPRANVYYAYTEDTNPFDRVEEFLEKERSNVQNEKFRKVHFDPPLEPFVARDPYEENAARAKFLDSEPVSFVIFSKPGLNGDKLAEHISQWWKCVPVTPESVIKREIERKSEKGLWIVDQLNRGENLETSVVLSLVNSRVRERDVAHRGIVLEGLPLIPSCPEINQQVVCPDYSVDSSKRCGDECRARNLDPRDRNESSSESSSSLEPYKTKRTNVKPDDRLNLLLRKTIQETLKDVSNKIQLRNRVNPFLEEIETYESCEEYVSEQMDSIFRSWPVKPTIVVYIACPDEDVASRRSFSDLDLLAGRLERRPQTGESPREDEKIKENSVGRTSESIAEDLQCELYKRYALPAIEREVLRHNPQNVIRLEGRLSVSQMFEVVITRLRSLPFSRAVVPRRFFGHGETFEDEDYGETEAKGPENFERSVDEEVFKELSKKSTISRKFAWNLSNWRFTCPVELATGNVLDGKLEFAVRFMNKIFFLSSAEAMGLFLENPRPFVASMWPRTVLKLAIFGPPYSGKSELSEALAREFRQEVIDVREMTETLRQERQDASIALATLEARDRIIRDLGSRLESERASRESARVKALESWFEESREVLWELDRLRGVSEDEEDSPRDEEAIREKLRDLGLAIFEINEELLEIARGNESIIYDYAPASIRDEEPPVRELTEHDPEVVAMLEIETEHLRVDEIAITSREIAEMLVSRVETLPEEKIEEGLFRKPGFIVDGMNPDPEIWEILNEAGVALDDLVLVTEEAPYENLLRCWSRYHEVSKSGESETEDFEEAESRVNLYVAQIEEFEKNWANFARAIDESDSRLLTCNFDESSNIYEQVSRFVTDSYRRDARAITEIDLDEEFDDRVESVTDVEEEVDEEEELPESEKKTIGEDDRRLGDTGIYCPVVLARNNVLLRGKEEFAAVFMDKIYLCSSSEALEEFLKSPEAFNVPLKKPLKPPPARICIVGPPGSGKSTLAKYLSEEYNMFHINFNKLLDTFSGRDKIVANWDDEDSSENIDSSSFTNYEKFVEKYKKEGAILPDEMFKECFEKFFKKPYDDFPVLFDSFPNCLNDVEAIIKNNALPELVIELECSLKKAQERLLPRLLDSSSTKQKIDRNVAKKGRNKESEEEEDEEEEEGEEIEESEEEKAGSSVISEEEIRDRVLRDLEEDHEMKNEMLDKARTRMEEESIRWTIVNTDGEIETVLSDLRKVIRPRVDREISRLEKTLKLDPYEAEDLLEHGYFLLSTFGRSCPVQMHEGKNPFHMYLPMEEREEIFPILHRHYVYFVAGEEASKKFQRDPLKYLRQDSCDPVIPARISILGPPKCGKTTLCERLARAYGFRIINREDALRWTRINCHWTKVAIAIEESLGSSENISSDLFARSLQLYCSDFQSCTQGYILDGIPKNREETEQLVLLNIRPFVFINLRAEKDFCLATIDRRVGGSLDLVSKNYDEWREESSGFPGWLNEFTQNVVEVDATASKWAVWRETDRALCSKFAEIKRYFRESDYEKVHALRSLCVTPYEFKKRLGPLKYYCPGCLHLDETMTFSGSPPDRRGVVQFLEYFYWTCRKHCSEFSKNPRNYLPPDGQARLPETKPKILDDEIDVEHPCWARRLAENGNCVVTYADNLPEYFLVPGKRNIGVLYEDRLFLFCSLECRRKFLTRAPVYSKIEIKVVARRVPVPDARFDYLCEYFKPASKVPAFLNVVDIAGLVKGAAEGQGLGNAFLSHISACDAIFHLCRAFEDDDVTHVEGEVDPVRDLEIISEELRLKDVEFLGVHLDKLEKLVVRGNDKKLKPEYDTLLKVKNILQDEKKHIRFADWSANDIEILNKYLFLTSKPVIYLVNLSEKDYIRKKNKWLVKIKEWVDKNDPGASLIPFSGAFENKVVDMDKAEAARYFEENKVTSALDKIIVQGYKALQLQYFFTAGADEVKAWTIQKGTKAPQAAGRIHTDFEKGFIMAEVMKYDDFKNEGSEAAVKAAGKYRQQGRNYVVEDGDIIFFKFNAGAGLKDAKKK